MLIFPQTMKCAYILTFFFRINNFLANKQKGKDIHFFFFFGKGKLYMKMAITERVGSDNSNFSL